MRHLYCLLTLAGLCACNNPSGQADTGKVWTLFVGTYTQKLGHVDGNAHGIYTCRFDGQTGTLTVVDSIEGLENPSFLTVAPNGQFVYAVGENGGSPEQPYGSVAAYLIQADGHLKKINEVPSYGVAPCHISTDRDGKWVFVANYATGNVVSYGIKADGGLTDSLSMVQYAGETPWAHMIVPDPVHPEVVWAVDKGADRIFTYRLKEGRLQPDASLAYLKGNGPRHLDFHPQKSNLVAVISENSSKMSLVTRDPANGDFQEWGEISTLPTGYASPNTCADVHFHPNGRFLYGSNRGQNTIVGYAVDTLQNRLSVIGHWPVNGEIPRNFVLSPDGRWLLAANQNSRNIAVFAVNETNGDLRAVGAPVVIGTPVCLKFRDNFAPR